MLGLPTHSPSDTHSRISGAGLRPPSLTLVMFLRTCFYLVLDRAYEFHLRSVFSSNLTENVNTICVWHTLEST